MPTARAFVRVPDFQYSGNYYPQIRARLRQWARANVPEITNEDPREPFMQAESAFALMAHYNNTLLDMVANSLFFRTSTVPESVKLLLELINGFLLPAGPARVDMVGRLTSKYSTTTRLLESYRKFATRRIPDVPELIFENPLPVDLTLRTDQIGYAYGLKKDRDGVARADLSSVDSDIVTDNTGYPFTVADLNRYMSLVGSSLGNNVEDLRIVEVLEGDGGGNYKQVRLKGAAFISDSNLTWIIRTLSSSIATAWNTGAGATPVAGGIIAGDKIYIGHPDVMFDRLDFTMVAPAPPSYTGLWEFYDPTESSISPDEVVVGVSDITFDLTTLLGSAVATGAIVQVTYIPTGAKFKGVSTYTTKNVVVTSFLGQSPSPSDDPDDYLVKCSWRPLSITLDNTIVGSATLAQSGRVVFDLPQNQTDAWYKYRLYDAGDGDEKQCFFVRLRYISSAGAVGHAITSVSLSEGDHYVIVATTQGLTVEDNPVGSSTGEAKQEFTLSRTPYVLNSARVFVDEGGGEVEWSVFTTLIRSLSTDRHCVVEPQPNGTATLRFGDGVNGKIPQIGTNNIRAVYRIGADRNGNIGANTLTVNRDGVGVFRNIWNPRQGRFWIQADWATPEALERAKQRGPRLLRTLYRAMNATDCEVLAPNFTSQDSVRPVARARAYEEAFGPKTVELVVVGGGGAALSSDEIEELQEYFNGGTTYGYGGILLLNHQVTVTNYQPRVIPLNIRVEAFSVITEAMIKQVLSSLLNPTALEINGRNFVWRFGQNVPLSRIATEIFNLSPGNIFDVDVTSPSEDIQMTSRELPLFDVANSTIAIASPSFITA